MTGSSAWPRLIVTKSKAAALRCPSICLNTATRRRLASSLVPPASATACISVICGCTGTAPGRRTAPSTVTIRDEDAVIATVTSGLLR